ncbi:CHAT domain-containing protein [Fulvivirgaceae bacterium PWU4]|uniref:CHAT domain-containing protein n=1 Tax=Chryseosolibacter histidini TaxID=2782349 RepID=A0AAP2DLG5_9BACT|nr:CHAT domain-containing tetratricopeptide repeat protein [Chryseosolibacter histidini]MBT1697307.1 CHAT domain-containing protein [Chryseosolibacter histidini]
MAVLCCLEILMMKCLSTIVLFFCVVLSGFSQQARSLPDSLARQRRLHDDLANFIYTYVDAFLMNPTEERLSLLKNCERMCWRPLRTDDERIAYVIMQCNYGYYAARFGDIHQAVDAYENAWKIYSQHNLTGFDITEYCLKPLGNSYSMLGDYQSAANIIKHYLFKAEQEKNTQHLVSAIINLSIVYHDTGKQEDAIGLLKNALGTRDIAASKKGAICSNLARNFFDLGQQAEASRYALQALNHFKNVRGNEVLPQVVNTWKILSLLNLKKGDTDEALRCIERSRKIVTENPAVFQKRELAKLISEYASIRALQQQHDVALKHYQQALKLLLPGYKPENETDLPDKAMLYPENTIKEILDGLAGLYMKRDPAKALQCFELSFETEDLLRQTYHYQADRLQQQVEIRNRTMQCLTILHDLYERTKDHTFVIRAFQLAERTKAVVLREAVEVNARSQWIRHDSLLKREHDLTYKNAKLASELVMEQMKGEAADVAHINTLTARQTEMSIEIKSLQRSIAEKYPQYSATESIVPIDLALLQQKLGREDATLMSYVAGQDVLYAFIIDKGSLSFHKLPQTQAIYDHIRALNDLFASPAGINNETGRYKKIAFELNNLLQIPTEAVTKNLVIVPDGLLNYVPFEALLFQASNALDYASLPYLIKKFRVSYASSTASYAGTSRTPATSLNGSRALAMFPVFRNTNRVLKHSETEAQSMQLYVDGKFLFDNQATKKAFGENLHHYNIIHLSTHADAGSWLTPPSIEFVDSTLYLPEVYGLRIDPDLMVLSACETGVGKLLKGEGALSLARGFQYAGAHNIVFSLWKVNDLSTARLMASFYEHYFDGESKPGALRLAKLDYLANEGIGNFQKSPYFWASFIYYGDINVNSDHLPQHSKITWFEMGLLLLTFLFVLYLFLRRRDRHASLSE